MNPDDIVKIGFISKLFGFRGEVIITVEKELVKDIPKGEPLHILIGGKHIPFFYEIMHVRPDGKWKVKIEGIDNSEKATKLLKTSVFLSKKYLNNNTKESVIESLLGFTVIDEVYGEIGIADNYTLLPHHPVLHIRKNKSEILIPFIDEFIKFVNTEKREINIIAPEGLIELYCGSDIK